MPAAVLTRRDNERTRRLIIIIGVSALIATPVASARVDPTAMVLRKRDLPPGYSVLRANTGRLSNAQAAQGDADLIRKYAAWERLVGYQVEYDGGLKGNIASHADVFRRASGAAKFLAWYVKVAPQRTGIPLVQRASVLGNQAYVFRKNFGTVFFVVMWRYRNVSAQVSADAIGLKRTLALARVQQHRIAVALG